MWCGGWGGLGCSLSLDLLLVGGLNLEVQSWNIGVGLIPKFVFYEAGTHIVSFEDGQASGLPLLFQVP